MSLFGSLFTGVSALSAQSKSMGLISNNIANVNTTAYKRSTASFSTLVSDAGRSSGFSTGGVRANAQASVNQQGLLQQSNSGLDVGISGNGFFVVQDNIGPLEEKLYTRSGSFTEDSRGYLVNSAGFYLMGWPVDASGEIPAASSDVSSLQPVEVSFLGGLTRPTSDAEMGLNLDARQDPAAPGPHFNRAIRVYDSLGASHDITLEFTKTGTNSWDVNLSGIEQRLAPAPAPTTPFPTTSITFDGDGTIADALLDAEGKMVLPLTNIDWGNGSAPQTIDLDLTSTTQFSGPYNVVYVDQNGAELGLRTGVNIDNDGYVVASFSNGQVSKLYKLPIATFSNPNGLEQQSGNVYTQTSGSGSYNLKEPGQGGAGDVVPSALEASNVDLADEFSKMIITQRAYSAGTKVITTADQMLTELLQIR